MLHHPTSSRGVPIQCRFCQSSTSFDSNSSSAWRHVDTWCCLATRVTKTISSFKSILSTVFKGLEFRLPSYKVLECLSVWKVLELCINVLPFLYINIFGEQFSTPDKREVYSILTLVKSVIRVCYSGYDCFKRSNTCLWHAEQWDQVLKSWFCALKNWVLEFWLANLFLKLLFKFILICFYNKSLQQISITITAG